MPALATSAADVGSGTLVSCFLGSRFSLLLACPSSRARFGAGGGACSKHSKHSKHERVCKLWVGVHAAHLATLVLALFLRSAVPGVAPRSKQLLGCTHSVPCLLCRPEDTDLPLRRPGGICRLVADPRLEQARLTLYWPHAAR